MTDPTVAKQSGLEAEFWQLGAFARSGFAADDEGLAVGKEFENFLAMVVDRQVRIVVDRIGRLDSFFESVVGRIEGRLPSLRIERQAVRIDALEPCPLASQSGRIVAKKAVRVQGSLGHQAHERSQRIAKSLAPTIKQKPHRVRTPSSSSMSWSCKSRQKILL